jgi:uncharacterized protein YdhG (YjbR/CyaY superfamily)
MKKTRSPKRGSTTKKEAVPKSRIPRDIDEYLAGVPEPARSTLGKVRDIIRDTAPPEATEGISYMVPMFSYKGLLFGFAALADHCSLFVTNPSVIELFKAELAPYSTSKGTIRFPPDRPFPAVLLRKLVKTRVVQNETKNKR